MIITANNLDHTIRGQDQLANSIKSPKAALGYKQAVSNKVTSKQN